MIKISVDEYISKRVRVTENTQIDLNFLQKNLIKFSGPQKLVFNLQAGLTLPLQIDLVHQSGYKKIRPKTIKISCFVVCDHFLKTMIPHYYLI